MSKSVVQWYDDHSLGDCATIVISLYSTQILEEKSPVYWMHIITDSIRACQCLFRISKFHDVYFSKHCKYPVLVFLWHPGFSNPGEWTTSTMTQSVFWVGTMWILHQLVIYVMCARVIAHVNDGLCSQQANHAHSRTYDRRIVLAILHCIRFPMMIRNVDGLLSPPFRLPIAELLEY